MRLYVTKPSPYARKTRAAVHELGLERRVEIVELPGRLPTVAKPDLDPLNPLGKVPTLMTDDGDLVCDSPVIVAYLDSLVGGRLVPAGADRWRALTLEAIADGCMDAGVVVRLESLKEEALRDGAAIDAHRGKIVRALDAIEADLRWLSQGFDVGALALACALDWLVFRQIVADPLAGRPRLAQWHEAVRDRRSLVATRPA